ncbi:MAG: hypothetical protein JSW61_14370 [Candidatus Thorarchaeota archaeon]|nr:MAG: hypothetical protein JSW61_14370 [Candidatus Thorarchaeota archaeon]
MERKLMKIIERMIHLLNWRSRLRMGAVQQPTDLMEYLYSVRASAYQRITGKALVRRDPSNLAKTATEKVDGGSLVRRISRKER